MRLNIILFFLFFTVLFVSSSGKTDLTYQEIQITSSIDGTVTDPEGGALPGVTVTAINKETGLTVSAVTNDDGNFSLNNLPPGTYKVVVGVSGFKEVTVENVDVLIGRSNTLTISLADPVTDSIVGKIKGTVKNRSGLPIQGANITIMQLSNEKTYDGIKTDSEGKYEKAGLLPDRYEVRAEASGFRASEKRVRLKERQVKIVDFSLSPQ